MSFPMSSRPSLVPVAGVAALLALLTGAATWLASGKPLVGLIGLIGALAAAVAGGILNAPPGVPSAAPAAAGAGDADRTPPRPDGFYLLAPAARSAQASRAVPALRRGGVRR